MRVRSIVFLLLFMMFSAFSGPYIKSYKKLDNGVVIELEKDEAGDPLYIKLQVVSDDIIHVSSTPTNSFAGDTSLVIKEGTSEFEQELMVQNPKL